MLKITDAPFNLVKWHIQRTHPDTRSLKVLRTSVIEDIKDAVIEGISYSEEGELISSFYLIYYYGSNIPRKLNISDKGTVYLVVDKASKWKHLKSDKVSLFTIKPNQYQDEIYAASAILTKEALAYFWSEYCIKEFDCNPYKWYNEIRHLMVLYSSKEDKTPFTKEDLDLIYGKVSDVVKPYLSNIFTSKGKEYILQMTSNELFVVFIGTDYKKALILHYISNIRSEFLPIYMIFRQAFFDGVIRLYEAVIILDYLLNKETNTDIEEVKHLFGVY